MEKGPNQKSRVFYENLGKNITNKKKQQTTQVLWLDPFLKERKKERKKEGKQEREREFFSYPYFPRPLIILTSN